MEEKEALKCKVVLVGEPEVGKKSIICKYLSNHTPGANFGWKGVYFKDYDQTIRFEIWDTTGKEKYRSLAKDFYKKANVCILVYDITRSKTFEELKNYWIKEIIDNASANLSN